MRLVLLALLAVSIVGSAAAMDLQMKGTPPPFAFTARTAYYCNGVTGENAFYELNTAAYGNAYDVGVGGPLSYLDFVHFGWYTLVGPYEYHVVVYDRVTCTQMCDFGSLWAADAYSAPVQEIVDVCAYNCNVTGDVIVAIRPMSCYAPNDCYPDIYFDTTNALGCGHIVDYSVTPEECSQIVSTAGVVDFLFGIYVDECAPTATESTTWGSVKGLYR